MNINFQLFLQIAIPIVAVIIGVFLEKKLIDRPNLFTFLSNTFAIYSDIPDGQKLNVHTHSIVIQNSGKKTTKNVKIGHKFLPSFSIHPSIEYEVKDLTDGTKEICIPQLIPKERITINYLYFPPLLWSNINTYTKSDDGYAKVVNMQLQQQVPKWFSIIILIFSILGLSTFIYFIIIALKYYH